MGNLSKVPYHMGLLFEPSGACGTLKLGFCISAFKLEMASQAPLDVVGPVAYRTFEGFFGAVGESHFVRENYSRFG